MSDGIVPFRIGDPESDLAELCERLANARWEAEPAGGMRELVDYWASGYDWRRWEDKLNRHRQFTTTIDGTNVHFLHVRSPEPHALPLILSHGWPGSVAEFLDVIRPLSEPRLHGLDPGIAFDLVIPSLPGFAWSGPTRDAGWGPRRIARAWATLMERLGYGTYGAAGNDWGAHSRPSSAVWPPTASSAYT